MERQDPLRTGAIFKVLPQSVKAPPKIVKFDTSKTSAPSSATKPTAPVVQDPLREAFNQIYRATPTPKMFVGRSVGGFNSLNNSPYWPNNLLQATASHDSPLATNNTSSSSSTHSSHQTITTAPKENLSALPNSETISSSSSLGQSSIGPDESTVAEILPQGLPAMMSPNATKVARIRSSAKDDVVKPSRSTSASSSSSRGGSRSRTSGSDSLLLLVGGITRPIATTTSSSRSSSSTRESSQRSVSTERSTGSLRGKRTEEAQKSILMQATPAKRNDEATQKLTQQTRKTDKSIELESIAPSSHHDKNTKDGLSSSGRKATPAPQANSSAGSKRKRAIVDESEPSETDNSPLEKARAVASKSSRRSSVGNSRRQSRVTPIRTESVTEEAELDHDEEEAPTVTRSGRKSVPKKVIPLAEDLIQGEKQQQKSNRGKRTVTAPATSSTRPRATASRKSVGGSSSTAATTAATASTAPTRKAATTVKNTAWSTSEVMALYAAQGRTDISAPDFWELVAEGVAEVGFDRTAEECQQQWFVAVEEAAARKRAKEEKMKNKPKENEAKAAESKEETGEPPVPAKAKRTSKNALKKMAQESSKATRDDDIFDSDAMRSYWNEDSAVDVADFLPSDDLFEDLQLFDPTADPVSSMSGTGSGVSTKGRSAKRKSLGEEEDPLETEMEFGMSHVHKLHYRPPSKLFSAKSTVSHDTPKLSTAKNGKLSSTQVNRQVNAAVQGARKATKGSRDSSEESGSEELESEDEDE